MSLRELWEWGFQLDGRRYPWGTLPAELPELEPRGGGEHGLPTIHRAASAPHPERPVTSVTLQIAAEARLFEDAALAALRERLDGDLGPGEHVPAEHGPEKANSRWRIPGATVWLTAFPSDWGFNWGRSSGRLLVSVDRERVAGPYLAAFRSGLAIPEGELEMLPAPGLSDMREPWRGLDEIALALSRPELRATPTWVAAALAPERVAVWRSGDARGLSIPFFTLPFAAADPPAMRHFRAAPARGSGFSVIDLGVHRDLLMAGPGEAGLDAVAARLTALGVPVERVEDRDWG